MKNVWQLQEAKNQLSQMVDSALKHGTQTITRHGKPVVMVVAALHCGLTVATQNVNNFPPESKTVNPWDA